MQHIHIYPCMNIMINVPSHSGSLSQSVSLSVSLSSKQHAKRLSYVHDKLRDFTTIFLTHSKTRYLETHLWKRCVTALLADWRTRSARESRQFAGRWTWNRAACVDRRARSCPGRNWWEKTRNRDPWTWGIAAIMKIDAMIKNMHDTCVW